MNIKALITMLVLGSSSAAMATPAVTVNASAEASFGFGYRSSGPVIRDHREPGWSRPGRPVYQRPVYQAPSNVQLNRDSSEYTGPIYTSRGSNGWAVLTDPTRIEKSRQIIRVNGHFRAFNLQSVTGSAHIDVVKVMFSDGHQQTISLERDLNRWQSNLSFNVERSPIEYIVVYGTMNGNSSYRVLGS